MQASCEMDRREGCKGQGPYRIAHLGRERPRYRKRWMRRDQTFLLAEIPGLGLVLFLCLPTYQRQQFLNWFLGLVSGNERIR
jgi:hypothetical protein